MADAPTEGLTVVDEGDVDDPDSYDAGDGDLPFEDMDIEATDIGGRADAGPPIEETSEGVLGPIKIITDPKKLRILLKTDYVADTSHLRVFRTCGRDYIIVHYPKNFRYWTTFSHKQVLALVQQRASGMQLFSQSLLHTKLKESYHDPHMVHKIGRY